MKYGWIIVLCVASVAAAAQTKIIDEAGQRGQSSVNQPLRDRSNLDAIQRAFDNSDPRENIKRYEYNPDRIYKLRLREYMSTMVVLPNGEQVRGETLGDTKIFEFVPLNDKDGGLSNIFVVHNKFPGADTNLTVVGKSGNVYSFYLRVDSVKSDYMPRFVTYIDDPHIQDKLAVAAEQEGTGVLNGGDGEQVDGDYLRSLPLINPSELYYDYVMVGGERDLAPRRVFSDGHWTYFQFDAENMDTTEVPAVYKVVDGYDMPVNMRIVSGTVVAETTGDKWTLRRGEAHLCIHRNSEKPVDTELEDG